MKKIKYLVLMIGSILLITGCESVPSEMVEVEAKGEQETKENSKKKGEWQEIADPINLDDQYTVKGETVKVSEEQYRSIELAQPVNLIAWRVDEGGIEIKIKNKSKKEVKHLEVAYLGLDENSQVIKVMDSDNTQDDYPYLIHMFKDIKLKNNEEITLYKEVDNIKEIQDIKMVVTSFITEDEQIWSNNRLDVFFNLYGGDPVENQRVAVIDKFIFDMYTSIEKDYNYASGEYVKLADVGLDEEGKYYTVESAQELEERLKEQPLVITDKKYVVQDENYKTLYPDALSVTLKNNSGEDIKDAVIGYVAWDENNLPVKIKGSLSFYDPEYFTRVYCDDINLAVGKSAGENQGYEIDESVQIKTFKAIPISYTTFEGKTWSNPYAYAFEQMYAGKKLVE